MLALFKPSTTSSQGTRGENNAPRRAEEPLDGAHDSSFTLGPGTRSRGGTCARPHRHTRYTHMIAAHTCTYAQHTPAGSTHMSHTHQTHLRAHIQTHSHHTQTSQTDTQTHRGRHTSHSEAHPTPWMHRPTETPVTFHGSLNRELPPPLLLWGISLGSPP